MNKELIDLQRGSKATCVVIKNSDSNKLENSVFMDSRISDSWLFGAKMGNPIFKEKVDIISRKSEIGYFVITNFDSLSVFSILTRLFTVNTIFASLFDIS